MSLPADLPLPDGATMMRYMQRLMAKSVTGVAALERATGTIITGWVVVASLVCGLRLGFAGAERKSVGSGTSVSVRVDLGGWRIIKTKKSEQQHCIDI